MRAVPRTHAVGLLVFTAAALFGLWVVFVAGTHPQELLVGAICVAACTTFLAFVWRAKLEHLSFSARDVLQAVRVPSQVAGDSLRIATALVRDLFSGRPPASAYRAIPFATAPIDRRKLERQVLAVAYITISPNTIVLGIDQERDLILIHYLTPSRPSKLAETLGGGDAV